MSRGPGRVERIIERVFADHPDNAFTVDHLCCFVYSIEDRPNGITKAQLVSVGRAARKVADRVGWRYGFYAAGVIHNPASKSSGNQGFFLWGNRRVGFDEMNQVLADPTICPAVCLTLDMIAPAIVAAEAAGDHQRIAVIRGIGEVLSRGPD